MSNLRAHVVISGKVQGVYFRVKTREQALALGVTGWVKNRSDGTVEGVLEGERNIVEKLIEWCRQGPPRAVVSAVNIEWEDFRGGYSSFEVVY